MASNQRPADRIGLKPRARSSGPIVIIREDFFLARSFRNLDDLNAQLRHWLDTVANPRVHATTQRVVNEAFAEEKPHLKLLPLAPFRSLAGFDFSFQPSLDRNRILALAQLDFVDRNEVIHFLGPPGTGKSHLATALGVEAVKAGRSVYFASLADIISALAKAEREGQLRERIRFLCRTSLLIVDEIGYLPVIPGGGNLFFQLVNARYERGAMILTSNGGFAEWGEVFGDSVVATALLDRLLHHAVVIQIEGSSYRLRQHADLMPEHVRSKATINAPIPAHSPRRRGRPPKNVNEHMPKAHQRYANMTPASLIHGAARIGPNAAILVERMMRARPHPVTAPPWASSRWRAVMSVIGWKRRASARLPSMRSATRRSARSSNPGSTAPACLPNPSEPRPRTPTFGAGPTINKEREPLMLTNPMLEQMQTLGLAGMAARARRSACANSSATRSAESSRAVFCNRNQLRPAESLLLCNKGPTWRSQKLCGCSLFYACSGNCAPFVVS